MRIHLSDNFTYAKLFKFVLPSMSMMLFLSLYTIVDALFISNFVGKTAFAAISIVMPVLLGLASIGLMFGAGGAAVVGKTLGRKNNKKASEYLSTLIYILFAVGFFLGIIAFYYMRPIASVLGAKDVLLDYAVNYGKIIALALPFQMSAMAFNSFFVTAEKPNLGLYVTLTAGFTNIILDALFIVVFNWGLEGAAYATITSQILNAIVAFVYFGCKNDSLLHLTLKTKLYGKMVIIACINGASEMVGNIAASIVTMLYNYQLMRYSGENGVAVFGIIMNANFVFSAIFYGYTSGSAPIVSYIYGEKDITKLQNIFKKSIVIIGKTGFLMYISVLLSSEILARLFIGYDKTVLNMTINAYHIFSIIFLIEGFNIYSSGFFTALNNGKISAVIAFLRTFVFEVSAVLTIPLIWGIKGIWWSVVVAETAALIVSGAFILLKRKQYKYF